MNLKQIRHERVFTQQKLADMAGVNVSLIRKLEGGEYNSGNIAARSLLAIADALRVDPHELLPSQKSDRRGGDFYH